MILAVYGTLKRKFGNHGLLESIGAKYLETSLTKEKYVMFKHGIPFVVKDYPKDMEEFAGHIEIEIFEVPDEYVYKVDYLESHPSWYVRDEIEDIKGRKVWLYFMPYERLRTEWVNPVKPENGKVSF